MLKKTKRKPARALQEPDRKLREYALYFNGEIHVSL